VLVKRALGLLNAAFVLAILDLISQVHLPSFVNMLPKYLKDSTFSGYRLINITAVFKTNFRSAAATTDMHVTLIIFHTSYPPILHPHIHHIHCHCHCHCHCHYHCHCHCHCSYLFYISNRLLLSLYPPHNWRHIKLTPLTDTTVFMLTAADCSPTDQHSSAQCCYRNDGLTAVNSLPITPHAHTVGSFTGF